MQTRALNEGALPFGAVVAVLGALAACSPAARSAASQQPKQAAVSAATRSFELLRPGVYELEVQGMLCASCAGAVAEALKSVRGIESAAVDFDRRTLRIVVGGRRSLHINAVKRALSRASRRIDLGSHFTVGAIRYVP